MKHFSNNQKNAPQEPPLTWGCLFPDFHNCLVSPVVVCTGLSLTTLSASETSSPSPSLSYSLSLLYFLPTSGVLKTLQPHWHSTESLGSEFENVSVALVLVLTHPLGLTPLREDRQRCGLTAWTPSRSPSPLQQQVEGKRGAYEECDFSSLLFIIFKNKNKWQQNS